MRAGGVDPSRMGRKKRSPKPRPSRQKYNQDISTSTGPSETSHNAQNTDESENVDTSSGPIDGVAYVNAPRERLATTPATPGDDGVIDICKQFQVKEIPGNVKWNRNVFVSNRTKIYILYSNIVNSEILAVFSFCNDCNRIGFANLHLHIVSFICLQQFLKISVINLALLFIVQ